MHGAIGHAAHRLSLSSRGRRIAIDAAAAFIDRVERRPAYRAADDGNRAPVCRRRYALSRVASQ